MELPRSGRRASVGDTGAADSAYTSNANAFAPHHSPRLADGSHRVPQTPRLGTNAAVGSSGRQLTRRPSTSLPHTLPQKVRGSNWLSRLLGSATSTASTPVTPTGAPAFPSNPLRTPRPFYDARTFDGRPVSTLGLVRDIILRPFFLLFRRGPLLPLIMLLATLLLVLTYSTHPSTQSVKRRVQGAVGPYIPQRAADAIKWRTSKFNQQIWQAGHGTNLDDDDIEMGGLSGGTRSTNGKGKTGTKSSSTTVGPAKLAPPRKDGRLVLEPEQKHPIPALMERAKIQWESLKSRQSKTFAQAVQEYQRRYGRKPPKGFDKWYAFAKAHKVLMIDEFDMIDKDLLMYRAFAPKTFRKRIDHLKDTFDTTWTIEVKHGQIIRGGQLENHDRAKGVEKLMKRFVKYLPDQVLVYNGHDNARIAVAADERDRLETLARHGEYDTDEEPPFEPKLRGQAPHWGMPVFCPPGSAIREPTFEYGWASMESTGLEMPEPEEGSIGTLVDNFKGYMNICENPQYRHFHCTSSWVYQHHPTAVLPLITPGVQATLGDIHGLIIEQFDLDNQHDPEWDERAFTSLQWRGQTSGPLWEKVVPWRSTQRARLHLLSHQESGSRKIVLTDGNDVMRTEEVPNYRLNPLFLDAGMVGPAVQCVKEDGTCEEMERVFQGYDRRLSFDRASLYKYVLDVDGNSWSGRFRRLMMSNAAVVKATIFPEFWTDWIVPWLHFIPIQVDYSDMWDVMAFFRGGLQGEGAHDELGREIAEAGKEWVKLCFRWPDLEAYQYRLNLEYARLYNDETTAGSNDFNGDTSVEPKWEGTVVL
ncbi:hypothetical protein OIO90_003797 [Microbotryomycetes sp. JL221]|nr:hypothetical protein OIO90_003797 [Microbotryomycetes sp. JL221]